ncbi:hypothetical protein [Streptomyces acidicola]|uniref:Uncharacterized protein n=1 Tax=Streptomyces acidicola TaxID=2596892 RepID=A0A5N8X7D7_9ACTN|nr:hypothetical protein [Streptomyces acidicola]MPY55106.1 hypothetical protein [Streptomyces acidicola]
MFNAAAKDVRVNERNMKLHGALDDRFRTPAPGDPNTLNLGGRYVLNHFPEDAPWNFVAVGRGHDTAYWADFLDALAKIDPDPVNIEHEDTELGQLEGLQTSAATLLAAAEDLTSP